MDGERSGAHPHLLRDGAYPPRLLPSMHVRHLRAGVGDDRQLMDHDSHHRHRPAGHREGTGLRGGVDSGGNYLGRLLRGQDFAPVGHHRAGVLGHRHAPVQPHPLHDGDHCALACRHAGHLHRGRAGARDEQHGADGGVCCRPARQVPHHALAAGGAPCHGGAYCAQGAFHYHPLPLNAAGGARRPDVPAGAAARDFGRGGPLQGADGDFLREHQPADGERDADRAGSHARHVGHAGHGVAHTLRHVLRGRHDGGRDAGQHHGGLRALRQRDGESSGINGGFGAVPEPGDCRPVHQHHPHGEDVQRGLPAGGVREPVAEPHHGGCRDRDLAPDSVEHLRHDAGDHPQRAHADLSALLFLQPRQSADEHLHCRYRVQNLQEEGVKGDGTPKPGKTFRYG